MLKTKKRIRNEFVKSIVWKSEHDDDDFDNNLELCVLQLDNSKASLLQTALEIPRFF